MTKLEELLEYIEENIDASHIVKSTLIHEKAMKFESIEHLPMRYGYPKDNFKPYSTEEIHHDMGKMMYEQLIECLGSVELKDNSLPMIRANYGVGTLPSLFGLKCKIINNNMPWVEPLSSEEKIQNLIAVGVPSLNAGFGKKVSETHKFYKEMLSKYPKCNETIKVYHPDLQGPFDIAHLIWGSEIYYALYDNPELVCQLMDLVTQTYIEFMKRTKTEINDYYEGFNYHWQCLYPGNIVLRNDSAVNLSREMYLEFVKPYDERILTEFGGGSIHFCGRADQWIFDMATIKGNMGMNFGYMPNVDFGQNFLEFIEEKFKANKIPIIAYSLTPDEYSAFDKLRFNTGISLEIGVNSKNKALEMMKKFKQM